MTIVNGDAELPQKKKTRKRLSRRPLQRIIKLQVELGPWSMDFRDGKPFGAPVRYVLWISDIPRGATGHRFMSVVQAVHRPANLGDEIHNPILFRKIVRLPNNQDCELVAKHCYRQAQKAMYFLIKNALEKATRPALRSCSDEIVAGKTIDNQPPYWHQWEPGFLTDTLGAYRKQVMQELAGKYLGHWEEQSQPTTTNL